MIPVDPAPAPESARAALSRQLVTAWTAAGGPAGSPGVAEAAAAVAAYCESDLGRQALTDRHLSLLLGRALCRAGDRPAARRLVEEGGALARNAESCLALLEAAPAPWPAVDWLVRRVCRASDYTAFGAGPCWTLDWSRVQAPAGPPLEFAYASLLGQLIAEVAPLWQPSRGAGTLVHHGLAGHLAAALGGNRVARLRWSGELLEVSRTRLAREAERRGWDEIPECRLADAAY